MEDVDEEEGQRRKAMKDTYRRKHPQNVED